MTKKAFSYDDINIDNLRENAKELLLRLEQLVRIPPRNGEEYTEKPISHVLTDRTVSLTERSSNLAKLLAEGKNEVDALVMAGFNYYGAFKHRKTYSGIMKALRNICKNLQTEKVMALRNFLQYDAAEELSINAKWLLNEQVSLYYQCRKEKKYTQAVRLLHDISYHVDVDARVSNRIEIEQKVDYAALLNEAEGRVFDNVPEAHDNDVNVISIGERK